MTYAFGPPPGACACWHLHDRNAGACTFQNCGCPRARWSWSLVDGVRWVWDLLRGVR